MSKNAYTKLFHRILMSSIWEENDQTRLVWITLLAMTDENGNVIGTVMALARQARVSVEAVQVALKKFQEPDPHSLSAEFEGRRVEPVEGGWRLLNHGKYRDLMSLEQRREYYRVKKAEARAKEREASRGMTTRQVIRKKVAAEERLEKDFKSDEPQI